MEEETWRNHRGIMEEESWRRYPGGGEGGGTPLIYELLAKLGRRMRNTLIWIIESICSMHAWTIIHGCTQMKTLQKIVSGIGLRGRSSIRGRELYLIDQLMFGK